MTDGLPAEIPLFPLGVCLFPQGQLPLRIFEPRYLAMVGNCMKQESPFGVVLIRDGQEAGQSATFHEIGTSAWIVDFDQLEDGMLGIDCRVGVRFRVTATRMQEDGLILGEVTAIDDPGPEPAQADHHENVSGFLRQTLERDELAAYRAGIREDWSSSEWITFQTAELLPLSAESRQLLLEMDVADRMLELDNVLRDNDLV